MRLTLLGLLGTVMLGMAAVAFEPKGTCDLKLELVDCTGKVRSGLVQIRDANAKLVELPELLSRGFGLEPRTAIHDWSVVPGAVQVRLPQGRYTIRAIAGLETDAFETTFELTTSEAAQKLPLNYFCNAAEEGLRSANTHLHLMKLSRNQADRYLIEVPVADGLDVVFLSYLERAVADLEYTSNKYTKADLHRLSHHGAQFGNGEEHRHNFTAQGQGYGHVMLLNIPELIQPVSIGPGITKKGTDGLPLRFGIEQARAFGSTIIWCHNAWGLEDIPNWVMGRLHANNIFDGGTHGSYKHSFYRYLNAGLRVPFSTGTDWFMYDFSRVYVPATKTLTPEEWLKVLAEGRSFITNGPLLELKVDGKSLGDTVALEKTGEVRIQARGRGRTNFERIELVHNGAVAKQAESRPEGGHFIAELDFKLKVDEPCWLALRTPPPPVKDDPELQTPVPKNDLGCDLFSHTSAVFVTVGGRSHFDVAAAEELLKEMHESKHFIEQHAILADDKERKRVLATYDEGIAKLGERIRASRSREPSGT